jgi:hypothetical protein
MLMESHSKKMEMNFSLMTSTALTEPLIFILEYVDHTDEVDKGIIDGDNIPFSGVESSLLPGTQNDQINLL